MILRYWGEPWLTQNTRDHGGVPGLHDKTEQNTIKS